MYIYTQFHTLTHIYIYTCKYLIFIAQSDYYHYYYYRLCTHSTSRLISTGFTSTLSTPADMNSSISDCKALPVAPTNKRLIGQNRSKPENKDDHIYVYMCTYL